MALEKATTTNTQPLPQLSPSEAKKEALKKNMAWERDKAKEKVKGIFRFYEVPGGLLSFVYKAYKGDEVERYDLVDGQIYTLPLGVAKHLNKNVWYPVHGYMMDENGQNSMRINQRVRRCGFQSLEFVDVDDLTPNGQPLIEVTSL